MDDPIFDLIIYSFVSCNLSDGRLRLYRGFCFTILCKQEFSYIIIFLNIALVKREYNF